MNPPCDLCGLDCGVQPFTLRTPDKTLQFCCEGCKGIYQMLHEINEVPEKPAQSRN
ncbi:heavy metal translocating P-type ATPase metal-binding domain-containing protein [bacterium]|nr:heavy metal translocating P-type ATPase metal-binding domain-containing protein [bacterium]